ncbi:CPBP family intramembrane glutamic endopeptidase [Staphylococcus succinus]|uniref:CPBP family intramembrane glutamic endopeptidase n=1 Tax=Staphylococcus succinus TaxID=61015 RepID=UPI0015FA7B93|nr:CPBP family intramembrane glutamic endopeptidase [Staphylococcus succinus]
MEVIRKSSNFESDFEIKWFYINVATIVAIIAIYIIVRRIVNKQFDIPNKNKIKQFKLVDKLAFIIFAVYAEGFLGDIGELITKITSDDVSANQKNLNDNLENNPLWYSLFDSSVNAPMIEEIMFRGVFYLLIFSLFEIWSKGRNRLLVYVIFFMVSSIYFGVRHVSVGGDYQYIYTYIGSGIVFTAIFIITKNIIYSATIHAIGNMLSTLNNAQYSGLSSISGDIGNRIAFIMLVYLAVYVAVKSIKHRDRIKEVFQ